MTWPFAPPASDHNGYDHDREERLVGDILSDEWPDSPLKFLNRRRPLPGDRSANAKAEPDTTGGETPPSLSVVSPSFQDYGDLRSQSVAVQGASDSATGASGAARNQLDGPMVMLDARHRGPAETSPPNLGPVGFSTTRVDVDGGTDG